MTETKLTWCEVCGGYRGSLDDIDPSYLSLEEYDHTMWDGPCRCETKEVEKEVRL